MTADQARVARSAYPPPSGGCVITPSVIICRPRYYAYRHYIACPTCERKRRAVTKWEMWHGNTTYCLTCGERWEDGERNERPFRPKWRDERREYARNLHAGAMSRADFCKASRAYMDDYFREDDEAARPDPGASS